MHEFEGMSLGRFCRRVVTASPDELAGTITDRDVDIRAVAEVGTPMSFDGFVSADKDAFRGYSPRVTRRVARAVDRLGRKLGIEVDGLENIPQGRAVLVANHSFGFDIAFAVARIHLLTGRRVWALGEHAWWAVPGVRRLAAALGTVDGTQRNVDALLGAGELVLVLPGGLREAVKPHELRYRLLWGHRYGFVRAALRHGAPLVPVASLGADDIFHLVGNAFARSRWLHLPFPLPRPAHLVPIPHYRTMRFVIGEAIPVHDVTPGAFADEESRVRRLRREVEGGIHEIFEEELARRAHFAN
jgi:1-acyl-sn-glycerol-3-phosphate acyltransferase